MYPPYATIALAASATTIARGHDVFGAATLLLVRGLIVGVTWSVRASLPR